MIHNNPDINNTLTNNNQLTSKPYMGNYTSAEIGNMAKMGLLGGEMNKASQKQEMKLNNEDPQKFY